MERSKGTSGESFLARIPRVTSGVTVVGTETGRAKSGSSAQPSSRTTRRGSNRGAGLVTAPRPRTLRTGPTSSGGRLFSWDFMFALLSLGIVDPFPSREQGVGRGAGKGGAGGAPGASGGRH